MSELNVKVGDKVLYKGGRNCIEEIREVIKITPTGRIRISGSSSQFDKYGSEMGNRNAWIPSHCITVATKEDIERVKRNDTVRKAVFLCNKADNKNITYEQAKKIVEILEQTM